MYKSSASVIIFCFDLLALVVALIVSALLAAFVSEHFFDQTYMKFTSPEALFRLLPFTILSLTVLSVFFNRGHYTRRTPWWSQVRYVSITIAVILVIDGFLHYAFKYPFSRLWVILSWLTAFAFILIARQLARAVATHLSVWAIPTVVIGSGNNAVDALFALYSEKYTGYDVKALILSKNFKSFKKEDLPPSFHDLDILDGSEDYKPLIRKNKGAFFVLAPDALRLMCRPVVHKESW